MEEAINQAAGVEPPKKKQKTSPKETEIQIQGEIEEEEESGFWDFFRPSRNRKVLKQELKKFIMKHPDIQLGATSELEKEIDSLTVEQIQAYLEEANFKVQLEQVNLNGLAFLGIVGDWLNYSAKRKDMTKKLITDKELVAMVDELIPCDMSWMSKPFQVVSRILYHLSSE